MSAVQKNKAIWSKLPNETLNSKYEKCRHITEEIYKRINITFQIKNLAEGAQSGFSDCSDQQDIDSNDLSNETDLFAYERSDSLPSSASESEAKGPLNKVVTVNNNYEIKKCFVPIYKPPKKRLRKKLKKRPNKQTNTDTECSSDEAVPLSRIVVETGKSETGDVDNVMGVPKITILTTTVVSCDKAKVTETITKLDEQSKSKGQEKSKTSPLGHETVTEPAKPVNLGQSESLETAAVACKSPTKDVNKNVIKCDLCNLTCRGERGMRRHMAISHILIPDDVVRPKKKTEVKY